MRSLLAVTGLFIILSLTNYAWYHHQMLDIESLIRESMAANPLLNPLSAIATHNAEATQQFKYFVVREIVLALATVGLVLFYRRPKLADGSSSLLSKDQQR